MHCHTIEYDDVSYSKAKGKQHLLDFMDNSYQSRHYSFGIRKCGLSTCTFCKLPCLPQEVFGKLHHLPDAVIGDDHHYLVLTPQKDRPYAQKSKDEVYFEACKDCVYHAHV